jgi:GNAT superfamily N-acetyltransferase
VIELTDAELLRRSIEGVAPEMAAIASGSMGGWVHRAEGLLAGFCPATPQRSLPNSVCYERPEALERELDALARAYEEAGIGAWTVWVPHGDPEVARLLAERGHTLDASPRAMARALDELEPAPEPVTGVEIGPLDRSDAGVLNDRAYGYEQPAFRAYLANESDPAIHWRGAFQAGEPVSCVGWIELDDDACVTGVATPPEHQGRGIASWLLQEVLAEARSRGARSASLQATRAGAPIYERLGFKDLGYLEMWERRSPPAS